MSKCLECGAEIPCDCEGCQERRRRMGDILIPGGLKLCSDIELAIVKYIDEHSLPDGKVVNPKSYELVSGKYGSRIRREGAGEIHWTIEIIAEPTQ